MGNNMTPPSGSYEVRSGDTLGQMGATHDFNWREAKIWRDGTLYAVGDMGIPANRIRPGDWVVPAGVASSAKPSPSPSFKSSTGKVTLEDLQTIFTSASSSRLTDLIPAFNANLEIGKIDTEFRITQLMGQVQEEAGPGASLVENLNYSVSALMSIFSYYKNNPSAAKEDGRGDGHPANQQAIANHAYANRIGNGDAASGDGWRYRGRGLVQLTGRANYRDFTKKHAEIWGETINFETDPDAVAQPLYAVRSALFFWVSHELYTLADQGISQPITNQITKKIDPGATDDMRLRRWQNVKAIYDKGLFKGF